MAAVNAVSLHRKTAVVLFNLGGPDGPESVQPFLYNLFNDPAIIGLPGPFRRMLASFISRRRTPKAQAIYDEIGGKSPLVENTEAQAKALIVLGFINEFTKELPMEYAVELNKLIELEMEGSVG